MKRSIAFLLLVSIVMGVSMKNGFAQQEPFLISGPMLGYSEHRSVLVWYEVSQSVNTAMLRYWEKDNTEYFYEMDYTAELGKPYNPIKFELVKLKLNTSYNFEILLNGIFLS